GVLDPSFDSGVGTGGNVFALALQHNGQIVLGGRFVQYSGINRTFIARVFSDGSLDFGFDPAPNDWIQSLAIEPDDRILVGGFFTGINGVGRNSIARFNTNGSVDLTFDPGAGCVGSLTDPTLSLYDHTGALIAANDNWKATQQPQIQATGLAPPNDFEAAILIGLSPGAYTAFLRGKAMTTGIGLAEVYDVDPNVNAQPTNLSARAFVGTGSDVLIGGTIIGGNAASLQRVLVRALGPSLASAGIATPLA